MLNIIQTDREIRIHKYYVHNESISKTDCNTIIAKIIENKCKCVQSVLIYSLYNNPHWAVGHRQFCVYI